MGYASMSCSSALLALLAACGGGGGATGTLLSIPFDPANFSGHAIDNSLLSLVPHTRFVYEGTTSAGFEHVVVEVTTTTKVLLGVTCVEVHDTAFIDGALVEDTLDWYAQDAAGNVWYFGEDTKQMSGGVVVGTVGSWQAGLAGALPGVVMLAAPVLGVSYAQEDAPGVANDRARIVALADPVTVPWGAFPACLHTEDDSLLSPGVVEDKFYAPGVGLVLEIDDEGARVELILVEIF